jgi:ribonuclease HI
MINLSIFCDGASRGNPGNAAYGFAIYENLEIKVEKSVPTNLRLISETEPIYTQSKYLGIATNNIAEWDGLLQSLIYIDQKHDLANCSLNYYLDSNLVVQQIQGKWKVKDIKLKQYYIQSIKYTIKAKYIEFNHIYREYNKVADNIANLCLDNQ